MTALRAPPGTGDLMKATRLQIIIATAVVAVSLLAFGATPALAAKGGKPSSGGSTTTSATCAVSPNPVAAGAQFVISGSKFAPSQFLTLAIKSAAGTSFVWTQADANGNLSKAWQVQTAGSNSVKVYNSTNNALLATCGFTSY
jgi:hypothetical protein